MDGGTLASWASALISLSALAVSIWAAIRAARAQEATLELQRAEDRRREIERRELVQAQANRVYATATSTGIDTMSVAVHNDSDATVTRVKVRGIYSGGQWLSFNSALPSADRLEPKREVQADVRFTPFLG